jgi:nucleoside-diphosphate-sugar epimerase
MIVRLPPSVHDQTKQGLITQLTAIARKKQVSAYVGDGTNNWAAVHRLDAAHLFRLALEDGEAGGRYHAVAEGGIPFRDIAEAIGRQLIVPVRGISVEDASKHFGWVAPFVATDNPVSSEATQERLRWQPTHPPLMVDLGAMLRSADARASLRRPDAKPATPKPFCMARVADIPRA